MTRDDITRKRLHRILSTHGVAVARTLEQKISDAGPYNQRIDPHILTPIRNKLVSEGVLKRITKANAPWFFLASTPFNVVETRLREQLPVYQQYQHGSFTGRMGQTLEIAIYRALLSQSNLHHFGSFSDLEAHDDGKMYSKEEPPLTLSGRRLPGNQRLDFLISHQSAGWAGIEAKNVREWLYPDRDEIKDLINKCVLLDCIPVLIARRIPFVTSKLLRMCGCIVHEQYNQLLPSHDKTLASQAKHKDLLGYHDIRVGNHPDSRLTKFVSTNLPLLLPKVRPLFDEYKDLLASFGDRSMVYKEFAGRVRRRSEGLPEDSDWEVLDYEGFLEP